MTATLTDAAVRQMAREWYEALDRHDEYDDVVRFLAPDGVVLRFPEGDFHGLDGFRTWYDAVTHRFFDEVHEVKSVQPDGDSGRVKVVVNWQARIWDAPAAKSAWLGFDAEQTWIVTVVDGTVRILEYTVDDLAAMPGSASL